MGEPESSCIVETPYGPVKIEATSRGVRSIAPARTGGIGELVHDAGAARWLQAARAALEACERGETPVLPTLDVRTTHFQRAVWDAARRVPPGATTTYGAIARELGGVEDARAVGGALAANPLWWVIPCHRVVGADGAPHGFAWGLDLKRAMLAHENAQQSLALPSLG